MRHAILLLPLLSACAATNTPEACRIVRVAEVPLRLAGNMPLVEVRINERPALLLLDTGAEGMVVVEDSFARLGLEHDYTRTMYATGLGAQTGNWPSRPVPVALGPVTLKPTSLLVSPIAWPLRGRNRIDGLLGSQVLSAYDVDIDMAAGRFTLYEPRRCPDGPPPFAGPSMTLRATGNRAYKLTVPITVDGTELPAEVDTGASRTLVDAGRLGLREADLATDRSSHTATADPVGMLVHTHRFARLQVGTETVDKPYLMVGSVQRPGYDALLGTDYWRNRRVWISYAGRTLTIGPLKDALPKDGPR